MSEKSRPSSEFLAVQVVVFRTLGINEEAAIESMAELARRREEGEEFDYETFIEEKAAEIPKLKGVDFAQLAKGVTKNMKVKL